MMVWRNGQQCNDGMLVLLLLLMMMMMTMMKMIMMMMTKFVVEDKGGEFMLMRVMAT